MKTFEFEHPCHGKVCKDCETCIFDEPITDKYTGRGGVIILPRCNDCGNMIKIYGSNGTKYFNAGCGKHLIVTDGVERPRIIQRALQAQDPVFRPDWCPKYIDTKPPLLLPARTSNPVTYDDFVEKRNKMKELPSVINWRDIKAGDICVVPKLIHQKRKIILVKEATEYVLKCAELDENLNPTSVYSNIYSNDIDVNFIVKYHKF